MTGWELFEWAAWLVAALVAGWLLYDAYKTSRDYDEDFLVHTLEDFGEEADWQGSTDRPGSTGRSSE